MKIQNVIFITLLVYVFLAPLSCGGDKTDASTQLDTDRTEPVGIILNPSGKLPGLDIAVYLSPEVEHRLVAESFSMALHTARQGCEQELKSAGAEIISISGMTIFDGKLSAQDADEEPNPLIHCIKSKLNGVNVPKFEKGTHIVAIQLRAQKGQP
ncbi:MAG: hypothetical protein JXX29_09625 [Deltaproteobacteria bacterium]|nr:hypothetical protein [Deltaproteobacteria bacterium]MBN2671924.1 hypothetical protein [Deltaproteobacteria bacterium]